MCSLVSGGKKHCVIPFGKRHRAAVRWSVIKSSTFRNLTFKLNIDCPDT